MEDRYLFFGASTNIIRKAAITKFEELAKSDYEHTQHLPKQGSFFDEPDNVSDSRKFIGPVLKNV